VAWLCAAQQRVGDDEHRGRRDQADRVQPPDRPAAFGELPRTKPDDDHPRGMFTQNTDSQDKPDTITPPRSGPIATASPVIAPKSRQRRHAAGRERPG
jgi:hypothetical protein